MQTLPQMRKALAGLLSLTLVWAIAASARAQQINLSAESYLTPPREIADAVLAARHENVTLTNLSPDGRQFLIPRSDGLPKLERLARPSVYLAEASFDPVAARARQLWIRSDLGYDVLYHADKRTVPVQVPDRARVSNPAWSPDGSKLAFYAHFEDATHIYLADTETGYSRRLTTTPLLATLVTSFQWSRDGRQIQTVLLPDEGRRPTPKTNGVASEPKVRVARDGKNSSRTYRYLLESPHDMRLLEHLATGQLALIDVNDGKVTKVGFPNMIRSVSMAPGEQSFRVTVLKKPFSYYVPLQRFGWQEAIWNVDGKCLHMLADRKIQEAQPQPPAPTAVTTAQPKGQGKGKGRFGQPPATQPPTDPDSPPGAPPIDPNAKRDMTWRPDGLGMSYLQLAAANVKDEKAPRKDRVFQWLPPYGDGDAKMIYETPHRIANLQYSPDCRMMFLTQTIDNQRQIVAVDLADPKTTHLIHKSNAGAGKATDKKPDTPPDDDFDDDSGDVEQQPKKKGFGGFGGFGAGLGPTLMSRSARGAVSVVRMSTAGDVYLMGSDRAHGEQKGLPRPYIDKVNIKTGNKTRIFEGKGELLENIDAVDADDIRLVFTTRQNKNVVPDSYVTDLSTGQSTKLTNNVDHTPWSHQLQTERLQVTRVDGFKFWVKVTTSPKHKGKLPALFWIYPREYADQSAYNNAATRSAAMTNRFAPPGPRSMTLLTLLGYAVVEPDVPIVGPPGRMNDNYIHDLRNSLWAVIDELDKRGTIDRDRLAVGGHSYGAFSTANALAHTPFFKAGIAGDGNYNRTLTPMSFQSERRQLWDARETYLEMSPLLFAHRINGALLMYHGMEDANVGTNPINAEYLFLALDGLGKPAALYMYPYEGHGPIAMETTLDLWTRWVGWLDRYVKNPQTAKKTEKK